MDCSWIARDDVFERYVRDGLGPEDRDAFEEHYFACAACFDKVRTYGALHLELPAGIDVSAAIPPATRGRKRWWVLVPAATVLLVAAAAALWLKTRPFAPPGEAVAPPAGRPVTPPSAQTAATPQPGGASATGQQPSAPPIALSVLARVEPPVYIPATLRGPTSDAAEKFQAAMARYAEGDYTGALPHLREAAGLKPDAAQYKFFLSICLLLTNHVDAAITGLRETIVLGESPYLEEAHFYLAKARLRHEDIQAARAELQRTIERRGRLETVARSLLAQVDALTEGKDRPPGK